LNTANLQSARIGNPHFYMVPKDEHTLRRVAWIDPFDLIKFLSVSLLLFPEIEAARAAKELGIIHSHRRSGNAGTVFDGDFGYNSFRAASSQLSQQRIGEWKVITDISNFFDRIGNHPLENHLMNISFVRYVDDFRFFASTRAEAYDIVRFLSELLAEEGLTLNNRKTNIFQIQNFEEEQEATEHAIVATHSQIDENERVEIQRRVQVSGRTSISRFYRHPGRDALRRLQGFSYGDIIAQITNTSGAMQEDAIRTATKYFIYVRQDTELLETMIHTKITSVFYIVDALIKDRDSIHPEVREMARNELLSGMGAADCSYPFQIPLLRLCATPGYEDPTLANAIVERQRQLDNPQFFREALLLGYQQMDRQKIRRMAQYVYQNVAPPMKRAIIHAVLNHPQLSAAQRRPLLRNLQQTSDDWFVHRLERQDENPTG